MKFQPRPEQDVAADHAVELLHSAERGAKQLYAAPTGVGKSIIELLVQKRFQDRYNKSALIVTPRDEIIHGMLDKLEQPDADPEALGIWTPVKLRNRMLEGLVRTPDGLIFDETHHHNATTWQQLDLLTGIAPAVGYTASPYRGSPRSTRQFREVWGEPQWIITYEEAIAAGYIRMPDFQVLPLVDDDIVDVSGGEFDVESLEAATVDRLGDCADHAKPWYSNGKWDKPTIFAMPSSNACIAMSRELALRGLPCAIVNAQTPRALRQGIFEAVEGCVLALLHIDVVSEGVDLKLRRYVDLAPTLSPVKWVQRLGRIMRPTEEFPEYICTNRNILRHAYILEGVVPADACVQTEVLFGPTTRAHTRVLGLEAIGRFKPSTAKLLAGGHLHVYSLSVVVGAAVIQYACLVHPVLDPIWATKVNSKDAEGKRTYGTWVRCEAPNDIRGFASVSSKSPSENQIKWWNSARTGAATYGLDPDQEVTRKSFEALPVLKDLGVRFR